MDSARTRSLRQGDMVHARDLSILGGSFEPDDAELLVLVTHDCDLASKDDFPLEFVRAYREFNEPKKYNNRKSSRFLDIEFRSPGASGELFRLESSKRVFASLPSEQPNKVEVRRTVLKTHRVFPNWLASWYSRAAFPDELVERMKWKDQGPSLREYFEISARKNSDNFLDIFLDLGEDRGLELAESEVYQLSVTVVYSDDDQDPMSAREIARGVGVTCHRNYGTGANAVRINLDKCAAVSDMDFTLRDLRRQDRWLLDSVSIKGGITPESLDQ